jgi:hypothetical protein
MATYDIDALKEDLPTAKDLAQFVYDKTQIALDLIGKPKEDQYQVAKNALEGRKIPSEYVTDVNPYIDRKELIPEDELPPLPERPADLPDIDSQIHYFGATNMPHPSNPQSDEKVAIDFRKYDNGTVTFQIVGPVYQKAVGERLNKFGQRVPEKYTWDDPRTAETLMKRPDGTFTERGRKLFQYCAGEKGGGIWSLIDRELTSISSKNIVDPWA